MIDRARVRIGTLPASLLCAARTGVEWRSLVNTLNARHVHSNEGGKHGNSRGGIVKGIWITLILGLIMAISLLSACQPAATPAPAPGQQPTPTPTLEDFKFSGVIESIVNIR